MLEWIRFGLVALFMLAGVVTLFISVFGTFRLDYSLNRLHASAVADTLVLLLFVIGCIIASGINVTAAKLIIVIFIQWCTSPLISHMFVKTKLKTDEKLKLHCRIPEDNAATQSTDKEEK
ncbi:MAG: monovalent cation/H(+) antiporter subunit G [Clostridia bacterium]|nr:monovalent cation/H(+) antiporter subunit G [Clostridia bacterium]